MVRLNRNIIVIKKVKALRRKLKGFIQNIKGMVLGPCLFVYVKIVIIHKFSLGCLNENRICINWKYIIAKPDHRCNN